MKSNLQILLFSLFSTLLLNPVTTYAQMESITLADDAKAILKSTTGNSYSSMKLIPVERKDVYDHYIVFNSYLNILELFDGQKVDTVLLPPNTYPGISKNQKYFTITAYDPEKVEQSVCQVTLKDIQNRTICSGAVKALISDEGYNTFIPFDDGSGIVQDANGMSGELNCALYKIQSNGQGFKQLFAKEQLYSTNAQIVFDCNNQHTTIAYCPADKVEMVVAQIDVNGKELWQTTFLDVIPWFRLDLAKKDAKVVLFCVKKELDFLSHWIYLLDAAGNFLCKSEINNGSEIAFQSVMDDDYAIISSKRSEIYFFSLTNCNVKNEVTRDEKDMLVRGGTFFSGLMANVYFKGELKRNELIKNMYYAPSENGLYLENKEHEHCKIVLPFQGLLTGIETQKGMLFLLEETGNWENKSVTNFYKVVFQ